MTKEGKDYKSMVDGLSEYGPILCSLIRELTSEANIQVQSIEFRVKAEESVLKKVSSSPDKYSGIDDLTDLLGIRVVTYFHEDVYRVAKLIEDNFKIDEKNSVDKSEKLEADKFGYLSVHYIASLKGVRSGLVEYKRFTDKVFEVQIRTVLQHAWAEIEHDLGYKAEKSTPKEVTRRFARIAGILELADEEFVRLRQELSTYEDQVSKTISNAPETLHIDQSTISAALKSEKILIELDEIIAQFVQRPLAKHLENKYAANRAKDMISLGVSDISELLQLAHKYKKEIEDFAQIWLQRKSAGGPLSTDIPRGIGLFYLAYILAAQKQDKELASWAPKLRRNHPKLTEEVRAVWERVSKNKAS